MVKSEINIRANDKGVAQTVDRVTRNFGNAERQIQGFGKGISGTLSSIAGISTSLPLLLGAAAVGVGAFAVKGIQSFREFDKGLRNVNTIINVSDVKLHQLGDSIQKLSMKYGIAGTELNDAVYQAVSAGVDVTNVMGFMDTASIASIAGLSTVAESVDVLTTVMNSYKFEASEATAVSDYLFQTVKLGKTTFPELAASLSQVTPLAAASGVEFNQLAAGVATLTKQGTPTSQAITQIRAAIIAMNDTLGDGWADTMTLQDGMAAMAEKADHSNKKLKEMVGKIEGVNAILGTTGANFIGAASDLDIMSTSLGATNRAFGQQEKSIDFRFNRLKETLVYLSVELGEATIPTLGRFVDFLVDDVVPALKYTGEVATAVAAGIKDVDIEFGGTTDSEVFKELQWLGNLLNVIGIGKSFDVHVKTFEDASYSVTTDSEVLKELNEIGDLLNGLGIGKYFDVHVLKAKEASYGVRRLAEDYSHLYGLNDALYGKVEKPFSLIVNSAGKAATGVVELTEEQIKAAKALEKQWNSVSTTLRSGIGTAGLNDFDTKLFTINEKVASLHLKFGNNALINEYGEALSNALVGGMVSDSMAETIAEEEALMLKQMGMMDSDLIHSIEVSQTKKDLIREEMVLKISQVEKEEELQRRREESYANSFGNMSQASYVFYEMGGKQAKAAFLAYKAFSVTEIAMSTYSAATAALKPPPVGLGPIFGIPLAVSTVALGLANASRVASMSPGGSGGGGMGGYSVPSLPSGRNYDNSNSNNTQQITIINQVGEWGDFDAERMVREKLIPAIEKHVSYGGQINIKSGIA